MNPNGLQGSAVEAKLSGAAQNAVCAEARVLLSLRHNLAHFSSLSLWP